MDEPVAAWSARASTSAAAGGIGWKRVESLSSWPFDRNVSSWWWPPGGSRA